MKANNLVEVSFDNYQNQTIYNFRKENQVHLKISIK